MVGNIEVEWFACCNVTAVFIIFTRILPAFFFSYTADLVAYGEFINKRYCCTLYFSVSTFLDGKKTHWKVTRDGPLVIGQISKVVLFALSLRSHILLST